VDYLEAQMADMGDHIVVSRRDGKYDVFVITASGEQDVRLDLLELGVARTVARAGLEASHGKQIWFRHQSAPDSIEPFYRA
jgi:hypothetical protein